MRFKHAGAACLVASMIALSAATSTAQSVVCVNCATELTQLVHKLQLADSFLKQIEQLQQAIQQTTDMIRNSQVLDEQTFSKALDNIKAVNVLVRQAQGISFAGEGVEGQFTQRYPGYDSYVQKPMDDAALDAKRREWSADNNSDIQAALKAAGLMHGQIEGEEQDYLRLLEEKAATAEGRNELIQVGNLIAIEGLKQTQKLRHTLLLTMGLQAGALQRDSDRQATEAARWETFRKYQPLPTNDGARF